MSTIRASRGDHIFIVLVHVAALLVVLTVLYPLIYVLSCSFSSPTMVGAGKVWLLPKGLTVIGYERVFKDSQILSGYANTIFYTLAGTSINLAVTLPCGYALAKKTLPGRGLFMFFFMFTMYFSGGMIPTFLLVRDLRLYNTRAILLILGAFSTYNCIICRTFFSSIPRELEEAAEIDGCSVFRSFLRIVMPVSKALLGVMVLYFAVGHWNSYFTALIYLNEEKYRPLQLVLRSILVEEQTSAAMMSEVGDDYASERRQLAQLLRYSVIVVSAAPMLTLYPFLQKYFDQGVMIGSVKG